MKVYYPFYIFESRSDKSKTYTVNLRPPDEISCTCGAWKFYRNKEGNNGNCLHTRTIRQVFDIKWQYKNIGAIVTTGVNITFIGENSDILDTVYTISINKLNSLNSPIISSFDIISLDLAISRVFSILAREAIKEKQQRENNKPLTLTDLATAEKMKSELVFNIDYNSQEKKIIEQNKLLTFTKVYSAGFDIGFAKEKIKPQLTYSYIDQLRELLKVGFLLPPEKISLILYYIEQLDGDFGDGRLIRNNDEVSIYDYKKSRNIQIRKDNETKEKDI